MTSATPTPSTSPAHRRRRVLRKPVVGSLVAASVLAGAWYATAGAAPTSGSAGDLTVTNTTVSLPAKFGYLSAGYNNSR
jgi:hypothetical protein